MFVGGRGAAVRVRGEAPRRDQGAAPRAAGRERHLDRRSPRRRAVARGARAGAGRARAGRLRGRRSSWHAGRRPSRDADVRAPLRAARAGRRGARDPADRLRPAGVRRLLSRPGRTIASAAADVEAICDALGLGRIATWGISGGGPDALACAALLPARVAAAASLDGVAPYEAEGLDWTAGMGESNVEEFAAVLADSEVLEPALEREAAEMLAGTADEITGALESRAQRCRPRCVQRRLRRVHARCGGARASRRRRRLGRRRPRLRAAVGLRPGGGPRPGARLAGPRGPLRAVRPRRVARRPRGRRRGPADRRGRPSDADRAPRPRRPRVARRAAGLGCAHALDDHRAHRVRPRHRRARPAPAPRPGSDGIVADDPARLGRIVRRRRRHVGPVRPRGRGDLLGARRDPAPLPVPRSSGRSAPRTSAARLRAGRCPAGTSARAVRPQSSPRHMYVCTAACARRPRRPGARAPRRGASGAAGRARGRSRPCRRASSPAITSNSCRSLTAAWWMCPATMSSAPASTSARAPGCGARAAASASATARRSGGGGGRRRAAPPAARSRAVPPPRSQLRPRRRPPDWCRHARTELSADRRAAPRSGARAPSSPTARSNSADVRVNRAGGARDVVVAGDGEQRRGRASGGTLPRARAARGGRGASGRRWRRRAPGSTRSTRPSQRAPLFRGPRACPYAGRRRGGCAWARPKQAIDGSSYGRVRRDLRRPLPRPPRRRRAAQAAPRRAADAGGGGGARPLAAPVPAAQGRRDRRLRASARSGSASPSAASSSAAGARLSASRRARTRGLRTVRSGGSGARSGRPAPCGHARSRTSVASRSRGSAASSGRA